MQNDSQLNHETLLVESFIIKEQKERFKTLLKNKNGRKKLREALAHSVKFDKRFAHEIPNDKQTARDIVKTLIDNNASKECYLISEHTLFDGKEMELEEAVNKIVGSGIATIISCIPGKLAYYEGEDFYDRLILISD